MTWSRLSVFAAVVDPTTFLGRQFDVAGFPNLSDFLPRLDCFASLGVKSVQVVVEVGQPDVDMLHTSRPFVSESVTSSVVVQNTFDGGGGGV